MANAAGSIGNASPSSGDFKERALDFAATAREQVSGGTQGIRSYIVKEPTRALGLALVLGVIVGWLIKRR